MSDDLYREEILDHYQHPRNFGSLGEIPRGAHVVKVRARNHGCGDDMEAQLVIKGGVVIDLRWTGTGCAISQASMSILGQWAIGKKLSQVRQLTKERVLELIGLPQISPSREKCALLPLAMCYPQNDELDLEHP